MRRSNVYWNECLLALSNRSGLRRVSPPHFTARFQSRRSVTSQTTMPSADFSIAVRIDCSILSQNSVARDFSKGTMETSRGKTQSFQRVNAGFIEHTPIAVEDFVVTCPLVPDVPHLRSGSCTSLRAFGLGFLQTPPHDDALPLLLTFGSAKTWYEDLHLASSVPCPAHTRG